MKSILPTICFLHLVITKHLGKTGDQGGGSGARGFFPLKGSDLAGGTAGWWILPFRFVWEMRLCASFQACAHEGTLKDTNHKGVTFTSTFTFVHGDFY